MNTIEVLDVEDARRLTERIRLVAGNIADNVEKLRELVQAAKDSDVHVVLGYPSWPAYLADVFGDEPLRLARDVRQELVAELAAQGMSTRSIAPIVGANQATVVRDLARGDAFASPEPDVMPDLPPRENDWTPDLRVDPGTGVVYEQGTDLDAGDENDSEPPAVVVEQESAPAVPRTVTGLDGKTYSTRPSTPRRTALTDDAAAAGWQLRKAIERIERIKHDDRFGKNKAEVMAALQPHLDFATEVLTDL